MNNWGLVDGTAEHILGRHLRDRDRSILFELARSSSVWERRIAIMATFGYVKAGSFDETLRLQYLRGEVETEGREGAGGGDEEAGVAPRGGDIMAPCTCHVAGASSVDGMDLGQRRMSCVVDCGSLLQRS